MSFLKNNLMDDGNGHLVKCCPKCKSIYKTCDCVKLKMQGMAGIDQHLSVRSKNRYNHVCVWLESLGAGYNPNFEEQADTYFLFRNTFTYFIHVYFNERFVVMKQLNREILFDAPALPLTKEALIYVLTGLGILK